MTTLWDLVFRGSSEMITGLQNKEFVNKSKVTHLDTCGKKARSCFTERTYTIFALQNKMPGKNGERTVLGMNYDGINFYGYLDDHWNDLFVE